MSPPRRRHESSWTFLSNHAHTLVCIARDPSIRLRDIARQVGITERSVQNIVVELEEAGVLERHRDGRRNHYVINLSASLRHELEAQKTVGDILRVILPGGPKKLRGAAFKDGGSSRPKS